MPVFAMPVEIETVDPFRDARALEAAGDTIGAIEAYQRLLLEEPDNIRARNELGGLFERLSLYLRALEQYEAANALAPDNTARSSLQSRAAGSKLARLLPGTVRS